MVFMKRLSATMMPIIILFLICLEGCTQSAVFSIDGNSNDWKAVPISISDPAGDTHDSVVGNGSSKRVIFEFDATIIKFAVSKDNLYVYMQFAKDMDSYFSNNKDYSRNIGTFYFDVDNDSHTGVRAFASNITGFESKLIINSGVWDAKTGIAGSGGFNLSQQTNQNDLRYYVEYLSYLENQTNSTFELNASDTAKSFENTRIAYGANFLELSIPLVKIGLQNSTNGSVRILFTERGSGLGDGAFSEPFIGPLYRRSS